MYICRRVYRLLLIHYKTTIFLIRSLYPRPNFALTVSASLGWIVFGLEIVQMSLFNKRPLGLNGHLMTIAHTQSCRGVS